MNDIDKDRQTGRTTRQIQGAPQGAVFIWCNSQMGYPRDLAKKTGRTDLEFVSPHWLDHGHWRGRTLTGIVVDHAARLTDDQVYFLQSAETCIR